MGEPPKNLAYWIPVFVARGAQAPDTFPMVPSMQGGHLSRGVQILG